MHTKRILTVVAAAAFAMLAQTSFAQSTAPTSRAAVKAETKADQKAGTLTPAGQGDIAAHAPMTSKSTRTRAQRKAARSQRNAETRAARKSGQLSPAGEHVAGEAKAEASTPSAKSRSSVKAATKEAVKEGTITPAGEGVGPKK